MSLALRHKVLRRMTNFRFLLVKVREVLLLKILRKAKGAVKA